MPRSPSVSSPSPAKDARERNLSPPAVQSSSSNAVALSNSAATVNSDDEIDWEDVDARLALEAADKRIADASKAPRSSAPVDVPLPPSRLGSSVGGSPSRPATDDDAMETGDYEPESNRLLCGICATVGDHDDAGHDAAMANAAAPSGDAPVPSADDDAAMTDAAPTDSSTVPAAPDNSAPATGDDTAMTGTAAAAPGNTAPATAGDTTTSGAAPVPPKGGNTFFSITTALGEERIIDMEQRHERITDRSMPVGEVQIEDPGEQGEDTWVPKDCTDLPPQLEYWVETPKVFKEIKKVVDKYDLGPDGKTAVLVHKDYRKSDTPLFKYNAAKQTRSHGSYRPDTAFQKAIAVGWNVKITDAQRNPRHEVFSHLKKDAAQGHHETITVKFGLGTQIPHIVVRLAKPVKPVAEGETPEQQKPVFVTIFANNLSLKDVPHRGTEGKPIEIHTGRANVLKKRVDSIKDARPALNQHIIDAKKGKYDPRLIEVKLRLLGTGETGYYDCEGRRSQFKICGNVTSDDLQNYKDDVLNYRQDQPEDEKFLGLLLAGRINDLSLFMSNQDARNANESAEHMDFARYFRYVMTMSAELGNFWYFRLQSKRNWMDKDFPFGKLQVPRWTVKFWHKSLESQRPVSWADREEVEQPNKPALWAPVSLPEVYPHVDEHQFVLRGALAQDRLHQYGYVNKLCETHGEGFEVILFKNADFPKRFIVEVYPNMDMNKLRAVSPLPDTPLKIRVQGGVRLTGRVLASGRSNLTVAHKRGLEFVCDMSADRDDLDFKDKKYPASLEFTDDSTVFQRQMGGMISVAKEVNRANGVYIPNLLFGASVPAGKDVNYYKKTTSRADRATYHAHLQRFNLGSGQDVFAKDCLAPDNSIAEAHGPPGTGKSTATVAVVEALGKMGFKVLVTAPTNGALEALLDSFQRKADMKSKVGSYAVMSTAYSKSGYTKRTGNAPSKDNSAATTGAAKKTPDAQKGVADPFGKMTLDDETATPAGDDEEDSDAPNSEELLEAAEAEAAKKAYFFQQSKAAVGSDLLNNAGYDHRRMQFATLLRDRPDHLLSNLGKRYIDYVNKPRLDKKEMETFTKLEAAMDKYVCRDQLSVVFVTLNSSGNPILAENFKPDYIVIEEAGCGITADMAIALATFGESVRTVIMIGDHKQLPPTVVSKGANWGQTEMGRTVFKRTAERPEAKSLLNEVPILHFFRMQHRSHPDIMTWASQRVYQSMVEHGPTTTVPTDVSRTVDEFFEPLRRYFKGDRQRYRMGINIEETEAQRWDTDTSLWNRGEVALVKQLVNALLSFEPKEPNTRRLKASDIKVITAYSGQKKALSSDLMRDDELHPECGSVAVETISSSQGKEAAITIFTLVRFDLERTSDVGFLKKIENLNVALTRAKNMSITVGCFRLWLQAVADKEKDFTTNGSMKHFVSFIQDFQSHGDALRPDDAIKLCDIIHVGDMGKAFNPDRKEDLAFEKTDWPETFTMAHHREELLAKQAGHKRGGKALGPNVKDAATGQMLKGKKSKPNDRYLKGG